MTGFGAAERPQVDRQKPKSTRLRQVVVGSSCPQPLALCSGRSSSSCTWGSQLVTGMSVSWRVSQWDGRGESREAMLSCTEHSCTTDWILTFLLTPFLSPHSCQQSHHLSFHSSTPSRITFGSSISLSLLSSQNMLRLRYFFLYNSTEKSGLTWSWLQCSVPSATLALGHPTLLAYNVAFEVTQLWDPSKPQLFMVLHQVWASQSKPQAALGPSGLSINVFPICRSTPWPSFENPAWVSSDSNTISYTHIPGAPPFRLTQTDVFLSFFCTTSP